MATIDLSQTDWTLEGWRPFAWRLGRSMETNEGMMPEIGPLPGRVPGSVQEALREAGILPDWHIGLNSRLCEWVEHRHWLFETVISAGAIEPGQPVCLVAEGLDYSGWILLDNREAGRFQGALMPHRFDLSELLSDGKEHRLCIAFEEPPDEQGQIGYTSLSRHFKPRYNYSWDWCPRLVPIGIWDSLRLVTGVAGAVRLDCVRTAIDLERSTGAVAAMVDVSPDTCASEIVARLLDGDKEIGSIRVPAPGGSYALTIDDVPVTAWRPNGLGEAKTYTFEVSVVDGAGDAVWSVRRSVGFRHVEWVACEGAPDDAEPWICRVNGEPFFLQGVNWTPVRLSYHDTTRDEYARLITMYKDMGCNLLRVWGGAMLETEVFYDLCDEAGILVWQEFPLSSSGIDNEPPRNPNAIAELERIAASYIERRAHHPSLLLWSGGNELQEGPDGSQHPVDNTHPCIAALKKVVERHDPDHRFISTSPSGPRFYAKPEDYGKGIHHDIHGPWGMDQVADFEGWQAYWQNDDSLFRSETGMPGASSLELIDRFGAEGLVWPPQGEYWMHTAAWWTQWGRYRDRLAGLSDREALTEYVRLTQEAQAQAYAVAAEACKARWPRCAGFLVWMGHDCFPCPANNSVIDFLHRPKPAYDALKTVFTRPLQAAPFAAG